MRRYLRVFDPTLFWLTLTASLVGLFLIFDAGYARSIQFQRGAVPREFVNQCLFLVPALLLSGLAARVNSDAWKRLSKLVWLVSIVLLAIVEVPGIGHELNGATRWIKLGPVLFQPAEFAKLAVVLYVAGVLATRKPWPSKAPSPKNWAIRMDSVIVPKVKRLLPAVWVVAALVMITLEPDLGTAAVLGSTAWLLFVIGGITQKSAVWGTALCLAALLAAVQVEHYRLERILNHFHRYETRNVDDVGYQTVQSELAMASGGFFGAGPGAGRAKHVLPAATTDFIPATLAEEFGFVGWAGYVGLLAAIVILLLRKAAEAQDRFRTLVLAGVGTWIGVQSLTNLLMANGFLPAIGIPLPFASSGGSSLIALWLAVGVCQSALAPQPAKKEAALAPGSNRWGHRRTRLSRA